MLRSVLNSCILPSLEWEIRFELPLTRTERMLSTAWYGEEFEEFEIEEKAPGLRRGLVLKQQGAAYRLTWRLVPPPGAPLPGSPLETNLTQSESLPL